MFFSSFVACCSCLLLPILHLPVSISAAATRTLQDEDIDELESELKESSQQEYFSRHTCKLRKRLDKKRRKKRSLDDTPDADFLEELSLCRVLFGGKAAKTRPSDGSTVRNVAGNPVDPAALPLWRTDPADLLPLLHDAHVALRSKSYPAAGTALREVRARMVVRFDELLMKKLLDDKKVEKEEDFYNGKADMKHLKGKYLPQYINDPPFMAMLGKAMAVDRILITMDEALVVVGMLQITW